MKKKINLYNYVLKPKDDSFGHPEMYGVYHINGNKIATDAHIMCVVKSDYPPELEKKIVDKKGNVSDLHFPDWQKAISKTDRAKIINIDIDYYQDKIKDAKTTTKATKQQIVVKIKGLDRDVCFEGKVFQKFLDFLAVYSDSKIYYTKYSCALKAVNHNGDTCLVMPYLVDIVDDFHILVDYPRIPKKKRNEVKKSDKKLTSTPIIQDETECATKPELNIPPKSDGIAPGSRVTIPIEGEDTPFAGHVLRCYELGNEDYKDDYIVIVQLDKECMEFKGVKMAFPRGLMPCLRSEIDRIEESDADFEQSSAEHCTESYFRKGFALRGNLTCSTGQSIYIFSFGNNPSKFNLAVLENGSSTFLYSDRGPMYSTQVTKYLVNGY